MRLRNNPEALDHLKDHGDIVYINPEGMKGKWHSCFENQDAPLYIEIGMGKGDFILENARRYPDINFIGMEKFTTVLDKALKKALKEGMPKNLIFLKDDAVRLPELFENGELDRIYLNFSDPWPKSRHAKRRLTYPSFLELYKNALKKQGEMIFKTDNRNLFEYSLVTFANNGFVFEDVCLDLHHQEGYEDNIQTEYERKFSKNGPIYRLAVRVKGEENG
ncbi:tRNA (guanosine(46)-N7)-methyltransferase TrmB [Sharpea azabuensis]